MEPPDATEWIRSRALTLGFDACRITDAARPESADRFREALAAGRHAEMHWLARTAEKRADPQLVLPGVRSVVLVAASYADVPTPPEIPSSERTGVVARYARHDDYHEILGERLATLSREIDERFGVGSRSLWYVDTGPVLERDLAQRAGLGFVGKHTGLISRRVGNWFLIGEILTPVELPPDPPEPNRCGSCSRCLSACPTGALPAPFTLDARRCISYLTIELKGSIPVELRPLIGNRVFGCDDCLAACPWNRFAREGALLRPHRRPDLNAPDLVEWLRLTPEGFRTRFAGTPMLRTKRRGLLRNVCVALGNLGDPQVLPELERAAGDPEALIAEHARWAVEQIEARQRPGSGKALSGSPRAGTAGSSPA
jgi:epoxyqueuosine reductase